MFVLVTGSAQGKGFKKKQEKKERNRKYKGVK